MNENPENKQQWFVIRVTYRRELAVKSRLDECAIESYIPMHWTEKTVGGRKRKEWVPMIHNLLFVRTTADCLKELKATTTLPICYVMDHATSSPAVVSDREMSDFMAIVASNERVEIVAPQTVDVRGGDRVRIVEGMFKGVEGYYVRHNGQRKVAVEIRDVATVLTAYVPMKHVEKI